MLVPSKFRGLIEPLFSLAQAHTIWWELSRKQAIRTNRDVLEKFPSFFAPTIRAHWAILVIATCQLFDRDRNTYSIPGLIRELKATEPRQAARLKLLCDHLEPTLQKIRPIRNKVYAHRDRNELPEDIFQRAGLTPRELQRLVRATVTIVGGLTSATGVMLLSTLRRHR
jgi:hypothetical protein